MTKIPASRVRRRRSARAQPPVVVCFGEVLWDCLPRGLFLGGAPINAAYHLARQGLDVRPVTAGGNDFLGDEVVRRLAAWGLDVSAVTRAANRPTGTVAARIDAAGVATYEIARDVAWDRIEVTSRTLHVRPAPSAIVYGTLALREAANRRTLERLLKAWPQALRVVDLNLRRPFDRPEAIALALASAQLVKLNDEEISRLVGRKSATPPALAQTAERLALRYRLTRVCVTAGARGAGLWWDGRWYWEDARPVQVRDTVGAGDAFLGGLLGALLLHQAKPQQALRMACRLGEFVATQDGATPNYRLKDL